MGDSTSLMMVLLLRFKRLLVVFLKMRACQGEVGKISEISPLPDPQLHSTYYVGKKASILKCEQYGTQTVSRGAHKSDLNCLVHGPTE